MIKNSKIVFDFDGVISDSIVECFSVSRLAFNGTSIADSLEEIKLSSKYWELFKSFRYLVGPAGEYSLLHRLVTEAIENVSLDIPTEFQARLTTNAKEINDFKVNFFATREKLRADDMDFWISLSPLFGGMKECLSLLSAQERLFISSTKDENSISSILNSQGIKIGPDRIYGADKGDDKLDHITEIYTRYSGEIEKLYFIDDNFNHLKRVFSSGVSLILSSWGYNLPISNDELNRYGIETISKSDFLERWAR